jgi:hypothetical protein
MNFQSTGTGSTRAPRTYGIIGILSAVLSLMFLSEIFGSAAIILGAYQMKSEPSSSFGMIVVVLGIICMLAGIYFFAYPLLIDLIFPA